MNLSITQTDFVGYELAMALKSAGFDEPCYCVWAVEPYGAPVLIGSCLAVFDASGCRGRDVLAPFMWQAQKWLREKKGVHCQVLLNGVRSMYFWQVRELVGNGKYADSTRQYDVFEDAMSDCIASALELIKERER